VILEEIAKEEGKNMMKIVSRFCISDFGFLLGFGRRLRCSLEYINVHC
jgi:hypothetical protein